MLIWVNIYPLFGLLINNMTIAVCEDDKDLLGLIELILADEGHNLITSSDEDTLRQIINSDAKIDLLIVDYWLKKTKADNIIKETKDKYSDLPVILMSAISDLPEVSEKLGVNDYIKKPFDIDNFKNKINNYINDTQDNNH